MKQNPPTQALSDSKKSIEQSIESLRADLSKAPDEAGKHHISKLISLGEDHVAMLNRMNPPRVEQHPSKLSLEINPRRILRILRIFGMVFVVYIVLMVTLNLLFHFLPDLKP